MHEMHHLNPVNSPYLRNIIYMYVALFFCIQKVICWQIDVNNDIVADMSVEQNLIKFNY